MTDHEEEGLKRSRERQRKVNLVHRVLGTPDGQALLEIIKAEFGTEKTALIPIMRGDGSYYYDTTHAALRDGQRSVVLFLEHLLSIPAIGDANIAQPKVTVKTQPTPKQ